MWCPNGEAFSRKNAAVMKFLGKPARSGVVGFFDLNGYPKAKRDYACGHVNGKQDQRISFVAVRETLPVNSA
jgi:hypothetical protein